MSFYIDVALLSGARVPVEATASTRLDEIRDRAQEMLCAGLRGRLLSPSGGLIEGSLTVGELELKSGEELTFLVSLPKLAAHDGAFLSILGDGSLVVWGDQSFAAVSVLRFLRLTF